MISSKWLELYQYIHGQIGSLPQQEDINPSLIERLMFLQAQFPNNRTTHSDQTYSPASCADNREADHLDWLEHEAFTFVLSEVFQHAELDQSQLRFLFETLMAAQMCQLAMATINKHKALLDTDEFKASSGLVYLQLGDYEMANSMFEEAIAINSNNPLLHCHLGFSHLYLGNSDIATACFERSITADPNFVGGYQNLAGLYYQDGKFEQSAKYAELAYLRDQKLVSTYITAASSYLAMGQKEKADQWIAKALANEVSSMELVRLAGICAHQNGRPEEALDALGHYLTANPANFDVLNIQARIKAELAHYHDLEADLEKLLVFEPHDEWCLEQLFLTYFHTEQWAKAQAAIVDLNKLSAHYKITYRDQLNIINKKLSLDIIELN